MKLTNKQQRFCEEYMIDLNASQAYVRAGYCSKTPNIHAKQLITNSNIQQKINELKLKASDKFEIRLEDVLKRIEGHALDGESEQTQIKAEDMLMKHLGGYDLNNKLELTGDGLINKIEVNFIDEA